MTRYRKKDQHPMSNAVTDEMVEAAKAAYWHEVHHGGGYSDKCYEAAIAAAISLPSQEEEAAPVDRSRGIETSIDAMREAAWDLIRKNGWDANARLSLHQVTGLMADLAMQAYRGEIGCGYPECG